MSARVRVARLVAPPVAVAVSYSICELTRYALVGAIAGAVIVLGRRSVFDIPTAVIAVFVSLVLWKVKKMPEPLVVLAAAVVGLAVYPVVGL